MGTTSHAALPSTLASGRRRDPKRWTFRHDEAGGYKLTNRIREAEGEAIIGKVAGGGLFKAFLNKAF